MSTTKQLTPAQVTMLRVLARRPNGRAGIALDSRTRNALLRRGYVEQIERDLTPTSRPWRAWVITDAGRAALRAHDDAHETNS